MSLQHTLHYCLHPDDYGCPLTVIFQHLPKNNSFQYFSKMYRYYFSVKRVSLPKHTFNNSKVTSRTPQQADQKTPLPEHACTHIWTTRKHNASGQRTGWVKAEKHKHQQSLAHQFLQKKVTGNNHVIATETSFPCCFSLVPATPCAVSTCWVPVT